MYDLIVITAVIVILLNTVWCSLISNVEIIEIKACKQVGVIFGGIMFCLAAFRDGIGFDFYNYKCIF